MAAAQEGQCIDQLLVVSWDPAAHAICQELHAPQLCLQARLNMSLQHASILIVHTLSLLHYAKLS